MVVVVGSPYSEASVWSFGWALGVRRDGNPSVIGWRALPVGVHLVDEVFGARGVVDAGCHFAVCAAALGKSGDRGFYASFGEGSSKGVHNYIWQPNLCPYGGAQGIN